MQGSDPKHRFKRVTDFFINKKEAPKWIQSRMCKWFRLNGIKERGWISISILKVILYASVLDSVHVRTVHLCAISELEEWEGLPCDTGHLCHSCFIYDMITNTDTQMRRHTPTCNKEPGHCSVCLSAARLSQKSGWVAWRRRNVPWSPQAALGQEAHHFSLRSQVNGRGSHCDEEDGVEERQWTRGLIVEMEKYLPRWPLSQTVCNAHTHKNTYTRTQQRKLLRRAVLSPAITLLPLWHGEIGAIWTPL